MPYKRQAMRATSLRVGTAAIRAVEDDGDWVLEIRAVPFNVRDSYGAIWDEDSELHEDRYPGGIPLVYYHGMDDDQAPADVPEYVGLAHFLEKRPDGAWYRGVLDKASEFARIVWEAAKKGMAAASVGGIGYLIRIDDLTGHVDEWPVGELSVFETYDDKQPSIPYAVALPALRALYDRAGIAFPALPTDEPSDLPRGDQGPRGAAVPEDITRVSRKGLRTMDIEKLKEIISALVAQFADALITQIGQLAGGGGEGEPPAPQEMMAEMRAEALKAIVEQAVQMIQKDTGFAAAIEDAARVTALAQQVLDNNRQALFDLGARAALNKVEAGRRAAKDAADKALAAARAAAPPISVTDTLGGHQSDPGDGARITGVEDLRYAHLSFEDMAMGYQLMRASLPSGLRIQPTDVVSEPYLRAMSARAVELGKKDRKRVEDTHYMRAQALRANEIDAAGNTGFGPEWISQMWSTMLWEKARSQVKLYETMLAKGMIEIEVPDGAGSVPMSTEGADPTVYSGAPTTDVDATNRPSVAVKISPFATGSVTLSPGRLFLASAYDKGLAEDSIIPILPQLNRQSEFKMNETLEQAMLNGDTVTSANTNLNLIDGTPGTGLSRPYYLNNNGIFKYPIITNTALARDANGQFSLDDFRLTKKLLPNEFRERLDNLLWILDSDAHMTALAFPELATSDVRPGGAATIEAGYITRLYGSDVLVTGFLPLANSAGKVPNAGGTLGRLGLVYCPYWGFGWKRKILFETAYDPLSQTEVVVVTVRMDFKVRGASAAAATYDIGIG